MELRQVAKRARRLYLDSPELCQQGARRGFANQVRRDFALESAIHLREDRVSKQVAPLNNTAPIVLVKTPSQIAITHVKPKPAKKPTKLNVKKAVRAGASTTLLIGAMLFGMAIQSRQQLTNHNTGQTLGLQTTQQVSSQDDQIPDESHVFDKDLKSYQVASTMPKIIEISKIGVRSRVLRTSQTKNGAVGVPRNIFDTAWYENSVIPGQFGSSLIVGHNHGPTTEGVFWNLAKLSPGDMIRITYGSGEQKSFRVESVVSKKTQEIDMAKILASPDSDAKLFLMSCSGKYDKTTESYLNRTVVESNWVQ